MNETDQTVFVVDDDEEVRDSLAVLFQSVGLTVRQYGSAQDFLDDYDPHRSGCLVLDIRMPGMSGTELQERLRDRRATLPVIMVTGHGDVSLAVRSMKAGALDFLQKPFNEQDLLDLVHHALANDAKRRSESSRRQAVIDRLASLTPREREVMELIVDGKANKNIASALGVSRRTVEIHRARVMKKAGAGSLAELVGMVLLTRD